MTTQEPLDTREPLDTKKIESLILNGYNERAAEELFATIENFQNHSDKELIYRCLSLLNLICDKAPSISLRTIKNITHFINDSDSWIRLVSLEISYQISLFRPNLLLELFSKIRGRLYDQDPSVRRLTVKIIGNLILSLHIDTGELQEIIEEYTEKLMDNDWKVIPGLYLAGNTVGNRFAVDYPTICPGISHGMALHFGRVAGINATTLER